MALVALMAGGAGSGAAATTCTNAQLVPGLAQSLVSQGAPGYAKLARGKDTLVKFFLRGPTLCTTASTQSIKITGGSLTVNNGIQAPFAGIKSFQSFSAAPAVTAAVATNSPADPLFRAPAADLAPPATATYNPDTTGFAATFTASVTYTRVDGKTTTSGLQTQFTANAAFERRTRALRLLVVPMGDGTPGVAPTSQYTASDQQATVNALATLDRILAVPTGIDSLSASTPTGIRYVIDTATLVNLKDPSVPSTAYVNGFFCGTQASWNPIKGLLEAYLNAWNRVATNPPADRVLAVVGEGISRGSDFGCAEGVSSSVSHAAWVRAVSDKPASGRTPAQPSWTGAAAAMELQHSFGQVPLPRSQTLHSANVQADAAAPDRAYNVAQMVFVQNDHSAMKFDTTVSPPWNNDDTFDEPADFAYSSCVLGGPAPTSFGECTGIGTAGTLVGVQAGPAFIASGSTDNTRAGTRVLWSQGIGQIQLTPVEPNSQYRYVRRTVGGTSVLTNIGFHVSFLTSAHDDGDEAGAAHASAVGQFGFAVPDDIPPPGSDRALIQIWKLNGSVAPTVDPTTANATLLYQREQQSQGPQLGGTIDVSTGGGAENFTSNPSLNDVQPALSADAQLMAWTGQPGGTCDGPCRFVRVAPVAGGTPVLAPGTDPELSPETVEPAWSASGHELAYVVGAGDVYRVSVSLVGGAITFGPLTLVYDADPALDRPPASHPTWSGDGERIAFEAGGDIWTISAAGGTATRLTSTGDASSPSWSHTAGDNRIAFVRRPAGGVTDTLETRGPFGGVVNALAVDPVTPATIYAGVTSGVFKTTTGGMSWAAARDGLPKAPVAELAIDPARPGTVYAAVPSTPDVTGGIFKTTDGGAKWTRSPLAASANAVAIDVTNTSVLYAGTSSGVRKSVDGGASWADAGTGLTGNVRSLAIDGSDTNVVYAGTDSSVFKSSDGGTSWAPAGAGLPLTTIEDIAVDPHDPSTLYVAAGNNGVYKSTDAGGMWSAANTGLDGVTGMDAVLIDPDPDSPGTVYVGTARSVFKTTDGGVTWASASTGLPFFINTTALALDPLTPSTVYSASTGVFKSTDAAATWTASSSGLIATVVGPLATAPAGGTVYAAAEGDLSLLFKSTDSGGSWSGSSSGIPDFNGVSTIAVDPRTPSTLYASHAALAVYRSTDGGASWTSPGSLPGGANDLVVDGSGAVYAAVFNGVAKSSDGGANWAAASSGLPTSTLARSLALGGSALDTLFVGLQNGEVYESTDGAASWTRVLVAAAPVTALLVDPDIPARVYAGTQSGAYRSADGGVSWSPIPDLAGVSISDLATPATASSTVFAATGSGLFRSTDTGANWAAVPGLPVTRVNSVAVDAADASVAYVGTHGAGVYVLTQSPAAAGGPDVYTVDASTSPTPGLLPHLLVSDADHPFWTADGKVAFDRAGNVWSVGSDGSGAAQLFANGSRPTLAGGYAAFQRLVGEGELSDFEIILVRPPSAGSTLSWEATGPGAENFVSALYFRCGGYDYVVNPSILPAGVSSNVARFRTDFDPSGACGGSGGTGQLYVVVTNGVQTDGGGGAGDPIVTIDSPPKPPRAVISYPAEGDYKQDATLSLLGNGFSANNQALPPSGLSWSVDKGYTGTFAGNALDLRAPNGGWPVGLLTFTLGVTEDGRIATATRTVRIVYDLVGGGFLSPVKNPPLVNKGNTGGTFPVKWQLRDANGNFIRSLSTVQRVEFQSAGPGCNFNAPVSPRTALSTGGTALRYDAGNEQYIYNWSLPRTSGCYVFTLTLADGAEHQAWVSVTK